MDTLKEFLTPKTFNRLSYLAVIFWILFGVILLGIFAEMEISDSFRCAAEGDKIDLIRGKCSEQYEKQHNKSGFPVYGFVIVNFFGIGLFCVIYSEAVKSKVDQQLAANRRRDENLSTGRRLFLAYICQLVTRLTLGIVFIVLQTQLLYPDNFPSDFHCQIPGGSEAANASSAGNTTMYECHNQRAASKTFWTKAVSVINGIFICLILIEIICILSRARKGRRFLEDWQFVKDHLPDHASRQIDPEPQLSSAPQQIRLSILQLYPRPASSPVARATVIEDQIVNYPNQIPIALIQEKPEEEADPRQGRSLSIMQKPEAELPSEFIKSLKESVVENTEKPAGLEALFKNKPGEGIRNKDRKIDDVYTKLVLIPNRAQYDFSGNREEQLKVYPMSKENLEPISREDIVDAKNKKILIVGRPGIGKTLFLTKLLRDWALDKVFNHFEFAFLLKFRKFNSVSGELSLRDLLSRSEYSQTLTDEVWNSVLTNPERVLIFFDGLDEFLYRSNVADASSYCEDGENPMQNVSALFYNIVEGNLLPGASVVTTTRPTAVSDVTNLSFSKAFEILGFAFEQIEEYVTNFATDSPENVPDAGKKIWEHIKTNMNLFSLCYIPVNCYIICACLLQVLKLHCKEGLTGVLPTKLTEIYKKALKIFLVRHDEHRDKPCRPEDIQSKDFSPEVEEEIKHLAKLAFDGLKENRLIFGQKKVPKDLINSALFHQLPDDRPDAFTREAQYCFIHLTMQEFLAAKHITDTMKGEELRRFVADHIDKGEWQLVLQFLAGLLGEQAIDIFTDLLPQTTEKKYEFLLKNVVSYERDTVATCWPTRSEKHLAVTLMKCINESNESGSVVQSKLGEIGFNAVDFSQCRLAPADCTAVVRFLQSCTQISLINLSSNNIGSLGCVEILKLFDNANCQLRSLNLAGNNIGDEGVKELAKVLVNNNESLSLNLAWNEIGDEGVEELAKANVNNNELRSLFLYGNNEITNEAKTQIQQAYLNCKVLV